MPDAQILDQLYAVIEQRKAAHAETSYTKSLLDGGPRKIHRKLLEEAFETATALDDAPGDTSRLVSEAADLVYHLWVLLALHDVRPAALYAELERRFGTSGIEEKAQR